MRKDFRLLTLRTSAESPILPHRDTADARHLSLCRLSIDDFRLSGACQIVTDKSERSIGPINGKFAVVLAGRGGRPKGA